MATQILRQQSNKAGRISLMMVLRALHKLRRRTWTERCLLVEALLWLGIMRIGVWLLSFRRITRLLGFSVGEQHSPLIASQLTTTQRIGWAVRATAPHAPWQSLCLAQALAAAAMLRRRDLSGTLYLGVAKDGDGKIQAHAWLRCGNDILTGGRSYQRYAIVAAYCR
jgi:hypothetical protein